MTLLAKIFNDGDNADLSFFVAWIAFWLIGIVTLVQSKGKSWLQGVAWIAAGFIALGFLFLTP